MEQNQDIEKSSPVTGWEMTDPRHHNPDSFRYIVHALADEEDLTESNASDHYRAGLETGLEVEEPVDPRVDPAGFLGRKYISCSLIDQDHQDTSGMTGVILAVPRENILQASGHDMGVTYNDQVYRLDADPHLPSPDEVLEQTLPGDYNEVLISGEGKAKFAGAFTVVYAPGKSVRPDLDMKIRELARK